MNDNVNTIIATRIKELRKAKGNTQKELAEILGISYSSIIDYENARTQPNSKAMAALERYFNVSGDYLRGNMDAETFARNSDTIDAELDLLISKFLIFKDKYAISSQESQLAGTKALSCALEQFTRYLLHTDTIGELPDEELCRLLEAFFKLNSDGQSKLAERSQELLMIQQYLSKSK